MVSDPLGARARHPAQLTCRPGSSWPPSWGWGGAGAGRSPLASVTAPATRAALISPCAGGTSKAHLRQLHLLSRTQHGVGRRKP